MKFCVLTLGCKVNTYESEYIKEKFIDANYKLVDLKEIPDIIIINTCTVTNQSDAKSRKMIRLARKTCPDSIIVVCGCSSQNHKENMVDINIDIQIGNYGKSNIVSLVEEYIRNRNQIIKFTDMNNVSFEDMKINNFKNQVRAFVKIQDGCNNFCSYCIIPYMRGNIRSKDINESIKEITELVNNGYKEIVLTGIHTGSYGTDTNYDIIDLIKEISKLEKLKRIRISSIEITELNDKVINELKINNKICNHLHIPIQSGSDKILKLMNRKYDINKFIEIVNKIRSVRPNINLTTDLIVGFPEETDLDHLETIDNLNKIKFSKIHTFPYSIRNNTPAASMKQVDSKIKSKRVHEILKLSDKLEKDYYNKFIGDNLTILVEEVKDGISIGHSDNYIKVMVNDELIVNEMVKIKVVGAVNNHLIGEIIIDNKK